MSKSISGLLERLENRLEACLECGPCMTGIMAALEFTVAEAIGLPGPALTVLPEFATPTAPCVPELGPGRHSPRRPDHSQLHSRALASICRCIEPRNGEITRF